MSTKSQLETCFQNYIQTFMSLEAGLLLRQALQQEGFTVHAAALQRYIQAGASSYFEESSQSQCFVGSQLPMQARPGDLWLDVVELSLMRLVPSLDDPYMQAPRHAVLPAWIALHPVYAWQFRPFVRCVEVGRKRTEFPAPSDYLNIKRFEHLDECAPASGIYHDEALAYTRWFGKHLSDQMQFEAARTFLPPEVFRQALPPTMHLWDESEVSETEFLRLAFSASTLDNDYQHELDLREIGSHVDLSNRMLFEEWETNEFMGLSCTSVLALGLLPTTKLETLFFDLDNAAPRP